MKRKSKTRVRRMRLNGGVSAQPRWTKPTLTFWDWKDDEKHECIVTVVDPYDIANIRSALNEIEGCWRNTLESLKP